MTDRSCSACGDPANVHNVGGCWLASPVNGRPDEWVDCGCAWDGIDRHDGCESHTPADLNCAACLTLDLARHRALPSIRYRVECRDCADYIESHCRSCVGADLHAHEDRKHAREETTA